MSAQTQAFVPAHTVWRNQGAVPQQLYGAYGQPLPQGQIVREYASPNQQYQQAPNGQYAQPPYPPQGGPPQQGMPPPATQQSPGPQHQQAAGIKRQTEEPHTPTLPPPNPATNAQLPQRSTSGEHSQQGQQYTYPDPTGLTPAAPSPASSQASFQSAPQPPAQPYYAPQQAPRRASPQPGYNYEQHRNSSSPQNVGNSTPGTYPNPGPANTSDPSLRPPPSTDGRSSPANGSQSRQGVRINELVGPSGGGQQNGGQQQGQAQQGQQTLSEQERGRSAADSDMLGQLNKKGM